MSFGGKVTAEVVQNGFAAAVSRASRTADFAASVPSWYGHFTPLGSGDAFGAGGGATTVTGLRLGVGLGLGLGDGERLGLADCEIVGDALGDADSPVDSADGSSDGSAAAVGRCEDDTSANP
jgi:hypothetical protein